MDVSEGVAYDAWLASLGVAEVRTLFARRGCRQLLIKSLSPRQDNDKNQIYVGGDLSDVAKIPSGDVEASLTASTKPGAPGRTKFTLPVQFAWIGPDGDSPAPNAKLIYYPQYPEVRLSGLIQGSANPPRNLYVRARRGQEAGRCLVLGITGKSEQVWALLLPPESVAIAGIMNRAVGSAGVFQIWDLEAENDLDGRELLLRRLTDVHHMGWVPSQRLEGDQAIAYTARNAGGYTLESLLGVSPNGRSEPDFQGWELKAHKVRSFDNPGSGTALTLMTPEPTGGFYKDPGVVDFMHRYGRRREDRPDRVDFTGRHFVGKPVGELGTVLSLNGWDGAGAFDVGGALELRDREGILAAKWGFEGLMNHWKRKHAHTCYVPYEARGEGTTKEFRFGSTVLMCDTTGFPKLLNGFAARRVYYDPGVNMQWVGGRWRVHRRSQFRVSPKHLVDLYESTVYVELR